MARRPGHPTHAERGLEPLRYAARPLTACQILGDLRADGVTTGTTIYRALDQLMAAGQVDRIESPNAWTACCAPCHAETPVFEICDNRGAFTEHLDARLAKKFAEFSGRTGFAAKHSIIEVRGRCGDCRSDAHPA